jgi:N-acetylglucosaminyl-diphospho-decaprenol L-rhamnosyltransferase
VISASNRHQLSVIVLNYRTPELVFDCLASLENEIALHEGYEVVVVDNCSGDDSANQIEIAIQGHGWSKWARVERSPVNGGFAAGNNVGIQVTESDYLLLINSDTIVRPGAISTLMSKMDERADLGMLGPCLEWPDGQYQVSTFRWRTPLTEMIAGSGLRIFEKLFPRHVVARPLTEFTDGLGWVSFACVLIRREVIDQIGLLDEHYFMYFEDMAYCRKAVKHGVKIGYEPDAHVVHLRGGSSPVKEQTKQRKRRPSYFYAARSHYFRSGFGYAGYLMANFFWIAGWLLGLARGRSRAVEGEFRDIWCSGEHTMNQNGGA